MDTWTRVEMLEMLEMLDLCGLACMMQKMTQARSSVIQLISQMVTMPDTSDTYPYS